MGDLFTVLWVVVCFGALFLFVAGFTWLINKPRRDLIEHIKRNNRVVSVEGNVITTSDGQQYEFESKDSAK